MGFLAPKKLPRCFDVQLWHLEPRARRIKQLAQLWPERGIGIPWVANLLYLAKLTGYAAAGMYLVQATPGLGRMADIGQWWTQPVVFQKLVIWSLLFEVLGLGCGSGPLALRFLPPAGGVLYWLRPGTVRLPPWPGRVPLTRGTRRGGVDVLLYLALLAALAWPLLEPFTQHLVASADGMGWPAVTHQVAGFSGPVLAVTPAALLPLVVFVPLLGLRDKTIFLAARAELYWVLLVLSLLPVADLLAGAKVLLVLLWWATAVGQLTRHFPALVAVLVSGSPLLPVKAVKRRLFARFPDDLRPSGLARALARIVIAVELAAPAVLLLSTDRTWTAAAVLVLAVFHLAVLAALPAGAPLEWNAFVIFAVVYLFWGHWAEPLAGVAHPGMLALLVAVVLAVVAAGNAWPHRFSFLSAMRYYGGNWATSLWALRPSALEKLEHGVVGYPGFPKAQMRAIYGEQLAEVLAHQGYVFRALQPHGRGLFGLLPRAVGPDHESYFVLDGECVAGTVLGWNFGDGHLHDERLLAALAERCGFQPGEVRVVTLEAQPLGSDRQEYRLLDGALGELERGTVRVVDLVNRQPWQLDDPTVPSGRARTSRAVRRPAGRSPGPVGGR